MASSTRVYHDPLHGGIALNADRPEEKLIIDLIDTPAFQRLRRVRQLGPASLTFHGAESSRFTHSIGVMAIARRAFDGLALPNPELSPHRATVLCAALLHDIGHGPFSHTAEEIFGCNHEHWTQRIILESAPIRELLYRYDPELIEAILAVYRKTHPLPIVSQLISSQLDCDRIDYLMRDSYSSGASYGRLDLDRLLGAMRFDRDSGSLVVAQKGCAAVEHYLIVRSLMYSQVYHHPKTMAAGWLLNRIFDRARWLIGQGAGMIEADATVTAWLTQDCNRLQLAHYLQADDGVFLYHLQRWQHHPDPILADLCRRFSDRDLLKAQDIGSLSPQDQQNLLAQIKPLMADYLADLNPIAQANPASSPPIGSRQAPIDRPEDYYIGLQRTFRRGYRLYRQGINIQTELGLREIGELSVLIQALVQPQHHAWLIYPRQMTDQVLSHYRAFHQTLDGGRGNHTEPQTIEANPIEPTLVQT
jgi:uncharacterized protein